MAAEGERRRDPSRRKRKEKRVEKVRACIIKKKKKKNSCWPAPERKKGRKKATKGGIGRWSCTESKRGKGGFPQEKKESIPGKKRKGRGILLGENPRKKKET